MPFYLSQQIVENLVNNNKFLNCCWMDYDSQQMVATMLFQSAIQLSHHVCIKWIQVVTCSSLRHAQTLDKNGSLIDPSGTESPHVQIWLETMQVQVVDQTTHPPKCHSFVGLDRQISASPPARRREKKRRGFTSIYSDVTHTHTPGRNRENPERQGGEKSGHKRRAKAETAQGGRGTNGPPEPTYTARRT